MVCLMAPQFDPASVTPLYEQAADYVAGQIERGDLRPARSCPPSGIWPMSGGSPTRQYAGRCVSSGNEGSW